MTEIVRLTLQSHGMTEAMSAGRFPTDEPLNALGVRQVRAVGDQSRAGRIFSGPEQRTRQTVELLGLQAETDALLADLDCGTWGGKALGELPVNEVAQWLSDPDANPHGGETITQLLERVRNWLHTVSCTKGSVLAVTHPAVMRSVILAALDAPPNSFWRIDIAPAGRIILHYRQRRWTLRIGLP